MTRRAQPTTLPGTILAAVLIVPLLACGGKPSPSFSTDFQPGGPGADAATGSDEAPADPGRPRPDAEGPDTTPPGDATDAGPDGAGEDAAAPDAGPPPDAVPPDGGPGNCEEGAIRGVPCGLNGRGLKPQSCTGGDWVDGGPCQDPDACVDGAETAEACGLNGRGTRTDACQAGRWIVGDCQDPDDCRDGASEVVPCGPEATGGLRRTCQEGAWTEGPCVRPGRWRCVQGACQPAFGDPACGDGDCAPQSGESAASCPGDCQPEGEDPACGDALDCLFLPWPAPGPGYWECRGLFTGRCTAVADDGYCGTEGWDWCYLDPSAAESAGSCPQDCSGASPACESGLDCLWLPWPLP